MGFMSRIAAFVGGYGAPPSDAALRGSPGRGGQVTPELDQRDTDRRPGYGAAGTLNYNGFLIPSEYNPDLYRYAALDVWERMRRSDPSVRETLWHLKAPIVNATWTVEPPLEPNDLEREVTAFVRAAFFEWMSQPWTELLTNALTYLDFGHAVLETEFQIVERSLVVPTPLPTGQEPEPDADVDDTTAPAGQETAADDEEGEHAAAELPSATKNMVIDPVPLPPATEMRRLPPRLFKTWRRFGPRLPKTLWQWHVDEFNELERVTQTVFVTLPDGSQGYKILDIPAENLVVLTNEKWGDEWTGLSILRAAYKPWIFKELIEKIAGIAYERHGVGIPVGYIPRNKTDDAEVATAVETAIKNLRAGESAYVLFPGPKQEGGGVSGQDGYLLEILVPPGGIPDFAPILEYFRGEIKGAMLARFSEMGAGSSSNRSVVDSQMEVWYNALHAVARYLQDAFDVAIRRLVDLNYQGVTRYPRLQASGIEARNLLEFAQAIALLEGANMISADGRTRSWVRATVDAPQEDSREARAHLIYEQAVEQAAQAAKTTMPNGDSAQTTPGGGNRSTEIDDPAETARPRAQNAK